MSETASPAAGAVPPHRPRGPVGTQVRKVTRAELTRLLGGPRSQSRIHFFDEVAMRGNATPEESTWPVVVADEMDFSALMAEPPHDGTDRSWIWEVLPQLRPFAVDEIRSRGVEDESLADDVLLKAARILMSSATDDHSPVALQTLVRQLVEAEAGRTPKSTP